MVYDLFIAFIGLKVKLKALNLNYFYVDNKFVNYFDKLRAFKINILIKN